MLVLSVINTGTADLVVSNITSDDGQFVPGSTSFTVSAGDTTDVSVTFTPTSSGAQSGTLSITHNATGSPSTVSMDGTGIEPVISLSPASLSYGNVNVSSPSVLVLSVINTGTADLVVSNITSDDGQFVPGSTSFTVSAGDTTDVNVTFTPGSLGAQSGTLSITHNATGSPSTVAMDGTGVSSPVIDLSPSSLDFGNIDLSSSGVLTLTVSNTGSADLVVSNITSDDGQFVPDLTSFTVTASNNQVVNITFTPTDPGTQTGTLTITHNGASSPSTVAMTADATVVVSATTVDFGQVRVGTSATQTLQLDNPSGTLVNITSVSSDLPDFASDQSSFAVAATGSATLTLTFTPSESGGQSATLSITHNPTITVTLVGSTPITNISENPNNRARLDPFEVDFGHQYLAIPLFGIVGWYVLRRKKQVKWNKGDVKPANR